MSGLVAGRLQDLGMDWDALLASSPSFGLLQRAYFMDGSALERDSVVVLRDDRPVFLLPLARTEGGWTSHPETFAASLLPLADAPADDLWPAVQAVAAHLAGERLTLRLRPSVVSPAHADAEAGAWRMLPTAVTRSVAVMAVDLRSGAAPSSRRRRALAKASKIGVVVRRADADALPAAWACIEDVYERRGLPGLLPYERVKALVQLPLNPAAVFVAEVDGRAIGAALAYRLGQAYRLPIYGMLDVPEAVGGTEAVIQAAAELARAEGCDFLDLGTSTDPRTGETVPGIARFKAEMGARPRPAEHLVVELPALPPP